MLLVRFEPTISAVERPQSYALDRAATGTGAFVVTTKDIYSHLYLLETYIALRLDGQTVWNVY